MKLKNDIETIMRSAGQILRSFLYTDFQINRKTEGGLVTEVDLLVEKFLIENLQKIIPGSAIWAEESGKFGQGEYCWVIDPLDGTANFVRGLPYFCISVALMHADRLIMGVIYQPISDEFFFASESEAAMCNNKPIQTAKKTDLSDAMVAFSFAKTKKQVQAIETVMQKTSTRRFGAIALDLAYIASGRIDSGIFPRAHWWDLAAGAFLIAQAGGLYTQLDGQKLVPGSTSMLCAGNKTLFEKLGSYFID